MRKIIPKNMVHRVRTPKCRLLKKEAKMGKFRKRASKKRRFLILLKYFDITLSIIFVAYSPTP